MRNLLTKKVLEQAKAKHGLLPSDCPSLTEGEKEHEGKKEVEGLSRERKNSSTQELVMRKPVRKEGSASVNTIAKTESCSLENPNIASIYAGLLEFGPSPGAKKMMQYEKNAADFSLQTGIYGIFRCNNPPKSLGQGISECARVGPESLCFCGHSFENHEKNIQKYKFNCHNCPCKQFAYVPCRPEQIGEYWLVRRADFDISTWSARCKCDHSHNEHNPLPPFKCKKCKNCWGYDSKWLCIACDRHFSDHETIFQTAEERVREGLPIGDTYEPLNQVPEIQKVVFNGKKDFPFEKQRLH